MEQKNKKFSQIRELFSFVEKQKLPLLGAILLGTLGHLTAIGIPTLGATGFMVSQGYFPRYSLSFLLWGVGICGVLRGVLHYGEQWLNHYLAFRVLADIRDELFHILRKLAPAKLEGRDKGELITVITNDIERLEVFFAHTLSPLAIATLVSLSLSLALAAVHWSLGLLSLISYLSVGWILPLLTAKKGGNTALEFQNNSSKLSSLTLESIEGMEVLLQFGATEERDRQVREYSEKMKSLGKKISENTGKNTGFLYVLLLTCHISMVLLGRHLLLIEAVEFPLMFVSMVGFISSFGPVSALANLGSTLQHTLASAERVLALHQEKPDFPEVKGEAELSFSGAEARNLHFSYEKQQVLQDFTLKIPQGQVLGLMGPSGCGKSTFLKLLMGFWHTEEGQLQISGTPISKINTANLRQMEGYLTQETQLFSQSILENIRISKANATQEEVELACRKASIHDFIESLPEGYGTHVGNLGDRLSGGERQRLGLARAFLHDAPFLLLDEPSSNLDALNEGVILQAIYQEGQEKTVVLVSHRPSTLSQVDQLIKIDKGQVVS